MTLWVFFKKKPTACPKLR